MHRLKRTGLGTLFHILIDFMCAWNPLMAATVQVEGNIQSMRIFIGNQEYKMGQDIDLPAGFHDLKAEARGFVTRTVRFLLTEDQKMVIPINMRRPLNGRKPIELLKLMTAEAEANLYAQSSICSQMIKETEQGNQERIIDCLRKTWNDDYAFAASLWEPDEDLRGLSTPLRSRYRQLRKQLIEGYDKSFLLLLENIVAQAPDHRESYEYLVIGWIIQKDCRRALTLLEEAHMHAHTSSRLKIAQAACLETAAEPSASKRLLVEAIKMKKPSPEGFFHLSRLNILTNSGAAEKILGACTHKFPAYYPCYHMFATYQVHRKKPDQAQKIIQAFLANSKKKNETLLRIIFRMIRSGDMKTAYTLLSKALAERPQRFELNWLQLLIFLHAGQSEGAERVYRRIPYTRIERPTMARKLIDYSVEAGFKEAAAVGYHAMLRMNPREPFYHWQKAKLEKSANKCPDAIKTVDAAPLEEKQTAVPMLTLKAQCQMEQQDFGGAIETYEHIISLDPDDWRYYYNMAVIQDKIGAKGDAYQSFKAVLERNPPPAVANKIRRINDLNN